MKHIWLILLIGTLLLAACGSEEQPAPEPTLSASLTKPTQQYVEYQWVEASLEDEGFLVLIHDETEELTVLEIVHTETSSGIQYEVINTENGHRLCETSKWTNGGGGASFNSVASCDLDLTVTLYGDWHLGSGNTVNASVVYSIFVPLNEDTKDMVVSIDGPEGEGTLITITSGKDSVSATWEDVVACEAVSDGTYSRANLATQCGTDENFGYGVIIYGHHNSVQIFD